jgi:hypothetical protein
LINLKDADENYPTGKGCNRNNADKYATFITDQKNKSRLFKELLQSYHQNVWDSQRGEREAMKELKSMRVQDRLDKTKNCTGNVGQTKMSNLNKEWERYDKAGSDDDNVNNYDERDESEDSNDFNVSDWGDF